MMSTQDSNNPNSIAFKNGSFFLSAATTETRTSSLESREECPANSRRSQRRDSDRSHSRSCSAERRPAKSPSFEIDRVHSLAKHIVSGNRNRYVDEEYDLDLTYITDRIIAMAFPGEDLVGPFSSVIRNNLKCVDDNDHNTPQPPLGVMKACQPPRPRTTLSPQALFHV